MTHAHAPHQLPTQVNLYDLPTATRDRFLEHMDRADQTIHISEIRAHHALAAHEIGLALPSNSEIAVCDCPCFCQTVFPEADAHEYDEGYGPITQCPVCTDDHRGTTAE
ncbi:hypothetical protein [Streptomyces sp. LZ34]